MDEVAEWPVSKVEDYLAVFANRSLEADARAMGKEKWEMTLRTLQEAEDAEAAE